MANLRFSQRCVKPSGPSGNALTITHTNARRRAGSGGRGWDPRGVRVRRLCGASRGRGRAGGLLLLPAPLQRRLLDARPVDEEEYVGYARCRCMGGWLKKKFVDGIRTRPYAFMRFWHILSLAFGVDERMSAREKLMHGRMGLERSLWVLYDHC